MKSFALVYRNIFLNVLCDDDVKLEENRIVLTLLELAQLNNVEFIPSVTLKAIVIPQYNPSLKNLRITLQDMAIYREFFTSQILHLSMIQLHF